MQDFLNFCRDYISIIVSALFFVLSLIIGMISNKCGKCKSLLTLLEKIPNFIIDAEEKGFKTGLSKFSYVSQLCCVYLSSLMNKNPDFIQRKYGSFIENAIETILSTPEKKEVITNEKKTND